MECYSCGSTNLKSHLSLGKLASCGRFPSSKEDVLPISECNLFTCSDCNLTQLHHDIPISDLYGDGYGYESSLNKSMIEHLSQKSKNLSSKYKINSILDIGCNDGTFLNFFSDSVIKHGIDPSVSPKDSSRISFKKGFFPQDFLQTEDKIDLITAISVFYDLPDPRSFVSKIKNILSDNGIFHVELSYLPTMVTANSFDTVCHEHLEYYSICALKNLFSTFDLHIIDFGFNEINGGSIWVDVSHSQNSIEDNRVDQYILNESLQGFTDGSALTNLQHRIDLLKEQTISLLQNIKNNNLVVHGLGASTKGNTLLQFYEIDQDLLPFIEEVNLAKEDKFTPGSKIPIKLEGFTDSPDYYFVLPWHFREFFLEKYKGSGVGIIFPLPTLEIIYP